MFDPSFIKLKYVFLKVQVFKITSLLKKYAFLKVQVFESASFFFQNYVILKKCAFLKVFLKVFLCPYSIIPVLSHCYS